MLCVINSTMPAQKWSHSRPSEGTAPAKRYAATGYIARLSPCTQLYLGLLKIIKNQHRLQVHYYFQ